MRKLLKHKWLKRLVIASTISLVLFFASVVVFVNAVSGNTKPQTTQLASAKSACTLDPQTFLSTVNQWRAAKGVQPLQYSTQLQQAAQARIADMEQYKYYGHTNPYTKQNNGYFTQEYDPAATWWDEVLDGPNNASQALNDLKNSAPHYEALTDDRENYIGLVSVYYPESWNNYDNQGKLQTTSTSAIINGRSETVTIPVSSPGKCLVVGQLANNATN